MRVSAGPRTAWPAGARRATRTASPPEHASVNARQVWGVGAVGRSEQAKSAAAWTVLAQFGNAVNPTYGGTPGPQRNQIPEPDRNVDNTTVWAPDFNQAHRQDYWVAPDASIGHFGWASVPLPGTGTTIRVTSTSAQGGFMQVLVNQK